MKKKQMGATAFDIIIYTMMIAAVIYVIVQSKLGNNNSMSYKLILGAWILGAVVINDFIEPKVLGRFEGMKEYKLQMYLMYAITDAAAYASLYIFIVNVGFFREPVHYVFLAVAGILFLVRGRLFAKYKKLSSGGAKIAAPVKELQAEEPEEEDDFIMDTLDEDEDDMKVFIIRENERRSYR